jgi:ABC-type antimicrobial peptide transport system permease subunit
MNSRATNLDIEIVGLVKDAKYSEVKRAVPAQIFLPYRQDTTLGSMNFYVRIGAATAPVVRAIPAVMANIDGSLPVSGLKTVPDQVRETLSLDRMISVFSAAFALLATLLAAVGLYGVLAYLVTQRTREIGVRMALGADGSRVRGMVLRQVGRMAVVGGALGTAAAIGVGQSAKALLFGLQGHDPFAIAAAALVLGLVAFAAGYLPALRASRVHPMVALRSE